VRLFFLPNSSVSHSSRAEFLQAIRSINPPSRWKILVIDEHSQQLLNSVLKQFDILEENVTRALPLLIDIRRRLCLTFGLFKVIESITHNREAQPSFDAVYMLMPTSANIDRIIRDFSGGRQQYAGAHLFFIDGPSSPSLYTRLRSLTTLLILPRAHLGTPKKTKQNKSALAEELFQRLTTSPAEPFLRGLQDLYVNFWGASVRSDASLLACSSRL
jgi:syntaxin-binding protein 1